MNDVRLQATLGNQNPTGLPVGAVRIYVMGISQDWQKAREVRNENNRQNVDFYDYICHKYPDNAVTFDRTNSFKLIKELL